DESRERDIKARISNIKAELDAIADKEAKRRAERRESGFDLVALAGYTNAGKSTLLRQLAAELDVDENADKHPDLDAVAESQDMLFTTLGTTTRRAELERREILLTDTVGFISDLPHWLVESFHSTLESVYRADLVLLVVDASEPIAEMREKLVTSHDTLHERNEAPILTVFNKVDLLSAAELDEKRAALSGIAPDPIAVSGRTGEGVDALRRRVEAALPDWDHERLLVPMADETMGLVSWIHDHAHVETESYESDHVLLEFEARPAIIEQARAKAAALNAVEST
ncbi:MAG: HflX GTPase family protein, partial [Halohasta sp.]